MRREMSGAPSGPGTARSCTEKAPPRARSSSVGAGMAGFGCRSSGIISGVNDGGRNSAKTERAAASSGSNGTGGAVVPEVGDVVVTGSPRVMGVTAILGCGSAGDETPGGGFGPPAGGSGRSPASGTARSPAVMGKGGYAYGIGAETVGIASYASRGAACLAGRRLPSSTSLCRRSGVGVDPGAADDAGAGPGRKQCLQVVQDRVQAQTGAAAFGSLRSRGRNSWAAVTRVTLRCQPVKVRPSKWARPRPGLHSG